MHFLQNPQHIIWISHCSSCMWSNFNSWWWFDVFRPECDTMLGHLLVALLPLALAQHSKFDFNIFINFQHVETYELRWPQNRLILYKSNPGEVFCWILSLTLEWKCIWSLLRFGMGWIQILRVLIVFYCKIFSWLGITIN